MKGQNIDFYQPLIFGYWPVREEFCQLFWTVLILRLPWILDSLRILSHWPSPSLPYRLSILSLPGFVGLCDWEGGFWPVMWLRGELAKSSPARQQPQLISVLWNYEVALLMEERESRFWVVLRRRGQLVERATVIRRFTSRVYGSQRPWGWRTMVSDCLPDCWMLV